MNNKGQCGRDFPSAKEAAAAASAAASSNAASAKGVDGGACAAADSPSRAAASAVAAAALLNAQNDANNDEISDQDLEQDSAGGLYSLCNREKHKWKHDQCMVCVLCGECTGYGSSCVSSGRPDRNPGMFCGCGSGDSGCSECGICRACAGKLQSK